MPPRMAFTMTVEQVRAQTKDVTRRRGWWNEEKDEPRVPPGGVIIAIEKGMGLPRGSKQVVICPIEVVSVRREPLSALTPDDVVREGFPDMSVPEFLSMFGGRIDELVTRIEFSYRLSDCSSIMLKVGRKKMDALFRDALSGFVTKKPPRWARAWAEGKDADRVHDWTARHLRHLWMTGIGAIESAEHMLSAALENGNLNDETALNEVS